MQAGIEDRRRELVVDGVPVVTGLVAVGDAWASTNPSLGRGMAIGALGAHVVRYVGRPYYAPGADRTELLAAVRGAERGR